MATVGLSAGTAEAVCAEAPPFDQTFPESFASSELVFVGAVTSTTSQDYRSGSPEEVTFRVDEVWKGETSRTTTLRAEFNDDEYLTFALPGQVWLVFARQGTGWGSCGSGSTPWKDDLDQYRPADAHPPTRSFGTMAYIAFALIGIALGAAMYVFNRRTKRLTSTPPHGASA